MGRADQRAYTRHALASEVILLVPGLAPASCRVLNACAGGCLLGNIRSLHVIRALEQNPDSPVEICVFDSDDGMTRVMGQQRRLSGRTAGIQFLEVQPSFLALLKQTSAGSRRSTSSAAGSAGAQLSAQPGASADHAWLLNFGKTFVLSLLDRFLAQCFEHKERLMLSGVHDTLAQRIEATYRQLLRAKQKLGPALQLGMAESLQGLEAGVTLASTESATEKAESGSVNLADLRLLEKDEFESWLEFQLIAAAVAGHHHHHLYMIEQRLAALYGTFLTTETDPFGPAMLGQFLKEAIESHHLALDARAFMFTAYQEALSSHLGEELPVLDSYLKQRGYLALAPDELRRQWPRVTRPIHPAGPNESPGKDDGPESTAYMTDENQMCSPEQENALDSGLVEPADSPVARRPHSVSTALFELMALGGGASARPYDGSSSARSVTPAAYAETAADIESCERYLASHDSALGAQLPDSESSIVGAIGATPDASLSKAQRSLLTSRGTLIEKLFGAISSLEHVPERLQPLMTELKLPMLRHVVRDPGFFDDPQHPLRRIMNNFMSLAVNDRTAGNTLPAMLEDIVFSLRGGSNSEQELVAINQRLTQLVQRQTRAFERSAERIAKLHEAREKMQFARDWVQHQLGALLQDRDVPTLLLQVLESGFEQIIILCYLRTGPNAPEVTGKLEIISQLMLWLSALPDDKPALFEMELEGRALMEALEAAFEDFGMQQQGKAAITALHGRIFSGGRRTLKQVEQFTLTSQNPLAPVAAQTIAHVEGGATTSSTVIARRWSERVEQFELGQWLERKQTRGGPEKLKLIWMDRKRNTFIFLSPRGMAEHVFARTQLLQMFSSGELSMLQGSGKPFSDQSLFKVIEELYQRNVSDAVHDPLTGCMTRTEFSKQLGQRLLQIKKTSERSGVLLFCNIDGFSLVNDNFGVDAGDDVLKAIPGIVDSAVSVGADTSSGLSSAAIDPLVERFLMGRLGSDDFALLIDPCDVSEGQTAALQIIDALVSHRFGGALAPAGLKLGMSVGVLGINANSGDAASVLKNAALSCRTAKRAGGGRAHLFSDGDASQAHQRSVMAWAYRIDNAIASNSFWLRAQKIAGIGVNSQAKPLYELLLGVRDEQGKQVSPAPLIEAGERFRKSSLIDRWVVETSLQYLNANESLLAQSSGYHINLSAHSLNDDAFLDFLEQRLSHFKLICNKIVFEITETAAVANTHYAADFMLRLKKLGCRFALDDFGTGFSSYNYLQNLPVDYLKIDGTFVTDITSNMINYAMVKSIAELGRFLGMEVIAECVEDRATIEALKTIGVEWVQGYAIGAPVPLAQSVNESGQ